jgi:phosphoglycolate phosphatase-like HAD superfamily hydrolase
MTRCVVFDFDGVLVDSNEVKRDAFYRIFAPAGAAAHAALDRVLAADVVGDRFDIIRAVLCEVTPAAPDSAVQDYASRYNAICEECAATCPSIAGADATLTELAPLLPLYVVSATPEEPLRRVIVRRRWNRFFCGVYGRPGNKTDHIARLAAQAGLPHGQVTVVGDGRRDLEAARALGCRFIGVRNRFNDFAPNGLELVDDLVGLASRLGMSAPARA